MKKIVTVVIADDHPIFRRGLCEVIHEDASVKLVGEADHGQSALQLIQQFTPTVAVLDHDMPRLNGLQVARTVRKQKLGTALVMLIASLFANVLGPVVAGQFSDWIAGSGPHGLRVGLTVAIPTGFVGVWAALRTVHTLERDRANLAEG